MDLFNYRELQMIGIALENEISWMREHFNKDSGLYKKKAEYEALQEKVEKMMKIMDSIPVEEN